MKLPHLFLLLTTIGCHTVQCISCNSTPTVPVNFGILLFPGFEALDVFGPLDALNLLSMQYHMNLSLIAKTLDPVTTKAQSAAMNRFNSTFGQLIIPTHTLEANPPLDVLFVPGGIGTRAALQDEIVYVNRTYPTLKYLITVCTGAAIAAKSGVLDGKNATSNKLAWKWVTSQSDRVNWIAKARWVQDGNTWSTSGVSAGIDGTLAWISDVYGQDIGSSLAQQMEFRRESSSTDDPFAALNNCTDVPAR